MKRCAGLFLALTAGLLAVTVPLFADEGNAEQESVAEKKVLSLSIEDAVKKALDSNITLKQNEKSLETVKRNADNAWNVFIPTVKANASFTQSFTDPSVSSVSIGGSASLALTPSLISAIRAVTLNYEKQLISYESAVRSIELNVRQLFYTILWQSEQLSLAEGDVSSSQRQYDSDLAKYNRGTLPRVNILSDLVSLQRAQLSRDQQKIAFENSLASYKQLLGLDLSEQIELRGSLEDVLSLSEISREQVDALRSESTTMQNYKKQLEAANNALLLKRFSAWGPALSVSYNLGWGGKKVGDGDFSFDEKPGTNALTVGVSIPLDGYLPWSAAGQGIEDAKDTIETVELNIQNQAVTEEISIQNYLNTIKSAQASIKLGQSSVDLAQQTYNLTLDAYNHGTRSLLELQNSRDNLRTARTNVMATASSLITAVLNLENTIGVPFGTLGKESENTQETAK